MKVRSFGALLVACALGVVMAGSSAAATPKPKTPRFDKRFNCATIGPAALMTSLAGGFGGTYTLKPATQYSQRTGLNGTMGGYSNCNYAMSATPPGMDSPTADGPAGIAVLYGPAAVSFYKHDLAVAKERFTAAFCAKAKAQNPNVVLDPRQCAPIPVSGIGDQTYEAGSYIAALRGQVFLSVSITQYSTTGNVGASADLLASIAKALLARIPVMR